jgi:putative ABC transport system permease protein
VAVTSSVAKAFGLHIGSIWREGGRNLQVVGFVENPLNLLDQFALVAPGQANPPAEVSILVNSGQQALQSLNLPSRSGIDIASKGSPNKMGPEVLVLVLGTVGLLFVGLMAVAGFTVMAQRRLRALGMLGALGATDRHIRLVMLANGAAVGASAAVIGTVIGLVAWLAFVPGLQSISAHRIDRFALPWWAIALAMILTFVTAVAAAWWPARAVSRVSVVAALSGRPPRAQPAHRFAALGGLFLAGGLVLLSFADGNRAAFIITGTLITAIGVLFLAPLAIQAVAIPAVRFRISVRLALRDLARFQARSGAALGAVTLAIGIAATIAVSAAAAQTPAAQGNLPANELVLHLTRGGAGDPIPPVSASQQRTLSSKVSQLASALDARGVVPLYQAYNPQSALLPAQFGPGGGPGGYQTLALAQVTSGPHGGVGISLVVPLVVATPAVLAHYGIKPAQVNPDADVITSRTDLAGLQLFDPVVSAGPEPRSVPAPEVHPVIQVSEQLSRYSSDGSALITSHAMQTLGLKNLFAGWLIQTPHPLTTAQKDTAQKAAAAVGLYVETRKVQKSLAQLRDWSTAAGILLALGVLGMTVGLIRSETANDLRTLTATGAASTTRRALTAVTAGALALLGAVLGTAGAYAALLAWHRSDLRPLGQVPFTNLVLILVGLPLIATAAGWLLSGREPPAIARRPLE